jgi:hypothetical protein
LNEQEQKPTSCTIVVSTLIKLSTGDLTFSCGYASSFSATLDMGKMTMVSMTTNTESH